jgi:hypothetical protein
LRHCISIATLTDYIGAAAAARLVLHYGGQTLKLPKRPTGRIFEGLCLSIGDEAAADLVESFGGEPLYVAMNQRQLVEMRRQEVIRRRAAGESFAHIASAMTFTSRFSERWVRKLAADNAMSARLAGAPSVADWQGDLFGRASAAAESVPADKATPGAQTAQPWHPLPPSSPSAADLPRPPAE